MGVSSSAVTVAATATLLAKADVSGKFSGYLVAVL